MDPKQEESNKSTKTSKSSYAKSKTKTLIPSTEKTALQLANLRQKKGVKRKPPRKVSYKRQKNGHDSDASSSAHTVAELEEDIRSTEDYVKQINKFGDIDAIEAVSYPVHPHARTHT